MVARPESARELAGSDALGRLVTLNPCRSPIAVGRVGGVGPWAA